MNNFANCSLQNNIDYRYKAFQIEKFNMGGQITQPAIKHMLEKYNYVGDVKGEYLFSEGRLYHKKCHNFDYLVILSKQINKSFIRSLEAQIAALSSLQKSLSFLKIYFVSIGKDEAFVAPNTISVISNKENYSFNICQHNYRNDDYQNLNIGLQYMNFSLDEYLAYKIRKSHEIAMTEYIYIMKTVSRIAYNIAKFMFQYLEFDLLPEYCFISARGQLKFYPLKSKFFKTKYNDCNCFSQSCTLSERKQQNGKECHTSSPIKQKSLNDKVSNQVKYLKQIQNMSLRLSETINGKVSIKIRQISNFHAFVLNARELHQLRVVQNAIINSKTIQEIISILAPHQDDFLCIGNANTSQQPNIISMNQNSMNSNKEIIINEANTKLYYEPRLKGDHRVIRNLNQQPQFNLMPKIQQERESLQSKSQHYKFDQNESTCSRQGLKQKGKGNSYHYSIQKTYTTNRYY